MGTEKLWEQDEQADQESSNLTGVAAVSAEDASGQVLADRTEFVLSPQDWEAWEAFHDRPARNIPELRDLMAEPSPFFVD